jgi:hypothetical protein
MKMRWRWLQNVVSVAALCGLFSQGAFAQLPGTFQPLTAVAAGGGVQDCIGGTITYNAGQTIHTFTNAGSNDFACASARTVNYLVVAGGGASGGAQNAGGGGAGGMLTGTGTIPIGTSQVVVGAGGIAAVGLTKGSSGGNSLILTPGGAGSWFGIMPSLSLSSFGSGSAGFEYRSRINTAAYVGAPVLGSQLRITIGQGASSRALFNAMYCGHAAAASPNLNYDGNQVQIKWAGAASPSGGVPTGSIVSDPVTFAFSGSKDLICATNWNDNSITGNETAGTNIVGTNCSGANAGNTTSPCATGTAQYWLVPILQIEAFAAGTILAQSTGGGGGGVNSGGLQVGLNGGSGGGGSGAATAAGTGIAGQGHNGAFAGSGVNSGSGGGGAGAVGVVAVDPNGGNGGAGLSSSITGTSVCYAGGGAGGPWTGVAGTATCGGGNGGSYSPSTACTVGTPNTGGGGGGGNGTGGSCTGGSGIVVISYPSSGVPYVNCIGGTITTSGANTVHTFATAGTFSISCGTGKTINYLIVAGGGAGGANSGSASASPGAGGAGGFLTASGTFLPAGASSVVVGAGSPAPTAYNVAPCNTTGTAGNSSIGPIATAIGGGNPGCNQFAGSNGGSGGGSSYGYTVGLGTSGQGNNGGKGFVAAPGGGGGGGGCGAIGVDALTGTVAGNGGTGCTSSITGTSVCYSGGGGGGITGVGTPGTATCGGGNAGASGGVNVGTAGVNGTGGGGGASSTNAAALGGSKGGDGIVVISYVTGSTTPPPPVPNLTLFANPGKSTQTTTVITATTTAPIVAGNLAIVAFGNASNNGAATVSVSDGTNSYTKAKNQGTATTNYAEVWYKANAAAVPSGSTISVTYASAPGGAPYERQVIIGAQSLNVITTSPLDQTAGANGTGSTVSVSIPALAQASEVIVCMWWVNQPGSPSSLTASGPGFTNVATGFDATNYPDGWSLDQKVTQSTAAVTYNPTWSSGNSGAPAACATFKGI